MVEQPVIRSSKVVLRPKRLGDVRDDYAWRSDEELAALDATFPLRQTFEEYVRIHEEEVRFPSPWSQRYSIDTLDGKHIGNCMCYDINLSYGEAEMGIMIGDREYWDQSYGYDSVTALVDHMFRSTSLRRLYLHTLESNTRARRCFEKCGFSLRRTVRRAGKPFAYMDLSRERWLEIREERLASRDGSSPDGLGAS